LRALAPPSSAILSISRSFATAAMVTMFPGFDDSWCNQPYFVVRQGTAHMRNTPNLAGGIGAL